MSSHHRDAEESAKTKDAKTVRVDADHLISRPRIAALDVLIWNQQPFQSRARVNGHRVNAYKPLPGQCDCGHMTGTTEDRGQASAMKEMRTQAGVGRSWWGRQFSDLVLAIIFVFLCGRNQSQHSWSRLMGGSLLSQAPGWRSPCRAGTQP